jgi:predicted RNase H-like HicB family nuclease
MAHGDGKTLTLAEFLKVVMPKAEFELMDAGEWFASIPGFVGLWATGETKDEAREELTNALIGWMQVQSKGEAFPMSPAIMASFLPISRSVPEKTD